MPSLTSAVRGTKAATMKTDTAPQDPTTNPGYASGFQANENAGNSGWMHPSQQKRPAAKFGGPHRKMHAPGFRGRK